MHKIMLIGATAAIALSVTAFAVAAENIKIAFIDPLSGPFAGTGANGLKQYEFAAETLVNEKGGVLDGQMFEIKWSTRYGSYERTTGFRRPIAFQDKDGNPFPLRPGRSWIIIATPYSEYSEYEPGKWKFRIYAPPGAGIY